MTKVAKEPTIKEIIKQNDPTGESRRSGLNHLYVPIAESLDTWTHKTANTAFRIWRGKLFRKEIDPALFGGYQIHRADLESAIAREWMAKR